MEQKRIYKFCKVCYRIIRIETDSIICNRCKRKKEKAKKETK